MKRNFEDRFDPLEGGWERWMMAGGVVWAVVVTSAALIVWWVV